MLTNLQKEMLRGPCDEGEGHGGDLLTRVFRPSRDGGSDPPCFDGLVK